MKKWIMLVAVTLLVCLPVSLQAQETPQPIIPGRIAYIGTDRNVYLLSPQENIQTALTDDAGISEDMLRLYQWPTWSTDGRLAYFSTAVSATREVNTEVFVSIDGDVGESVYQGTDEVFNYAYWSPQNCATGETCRDLAVLLGDNEAGGLLVELIRSGTEVTSSQFIGTGSPFYYSWSPDGTRMLLQRNGTRMDIYDVAEAAISDMLPQTPGTFFAPAWSPVDDRLLVGVRSEDGEHTDLVIITDDTAEAVVEGLSGLVYFSWSPDGGKIAYMDVQNRNRMSTLYVVDAVTGEMVARSSTNSVLAFFWSPDSEHIAYVAPVSSPGSFSAKPYNAPVLQETAGLAWTVLDIEDSESRTYGSFFPTEEMIYLLTFFDQFAQSHRIWSPDSRHLVYSEVTPENEAVISLIDATQAVSVPLIIAEGVIGVWSFG